MSPNLELGPGYFFSYKVDTYENYFVIIVYSLCHKMLLRTKSKFLRDASHETNVIKGLLKLFSCIYDTK